MGKLKKVVGWVGFTVFMTGIFLSGVAVLTAIDIYLPEPAKKLLLLFLAGIGIAWLGVKMMEVGGDRFEHILCREDQIRVHVHRQDMRVPALNRGLRLHNTAGNNY